MKAFCYKICTLLESKLLEGSNGAVFRVQSVMDIAKFIKIAQNNTKLTPWDLLVRDFAGEKV
jgi:hypothetical protein